jgi:hypothetical protein
VGQGSNAISGSFALNLILGHDKHLTAVAVGDTRSTPSSTHGC